MSRVDFRVDLNHPRFTQTPVHHAIEGFDKRGFHTTRYTHAPEALLAWIDEVFPNVCSAEIAGGGLYVVSDDAERPVAFAAFDIRDGVQELPGPDWTSSGPFGVIARARGIGLGAMLLDALLFASRERGYRYARLTSLTDDDDERGHSVVAQRLADGVGERLVTGTSFSVRRGSVRTLLLASGNGSNVQAVIDAQQSGRLELDVCGLVVNRTNAYAAMRAERAAIDVARCIWDRRLQSRAEYDADLLTTVESFAPELILLLGWMHVLPATFVQRFTHTLNVHPAFLPLDPTRDTVTMPDGEVIPAFRGAHAVDDALAANVGWIGASVHVVHESVDRGEILARSPLQRIAGESREMLLERLHRIEHRTVITAVERWLRMTTTVGRQIPLA